VSYSVGGRGFWYTVGRKHTRTTLSLPGSGLSLYQVHKRNSAPAAVSVARNQPPSLTLPASSLPLPSLIHWAAFVLIIGILIFVAGSLLAN
jgi:hypothetical protein